jgi:hypothetical protein
MPTGLWRFLALASALLALAFVIVDALDIRAFTDDHITAVAADGRTYVQLRVTQVGGAPSENGGLRPGDVITPLFPYTPRARLGAEPLGTVLHWQVRRGTSKFATTTTVSALPDSDILLYEIFNVVRLAMLLMAIVVAARRPDELAARALVVFLITMAVALLPGGGWLPDTPFLVWRIARTPIQILGHSQAVLYSCIFPFASAGGLRAWLRRINPWYTLLCASTVLVLTGIDLVTNRTPDLGPFTLVVDWSPMLYFIAVAAAFSIAARGAVGRDRQRVYWAAGSIGIGFAGPIVVTVLEFGFGVHLAWIDFMSLSLVAIPLGLAYTILRHRTIDIGFVISRALVLTILSAIIVVAFGLLERALGKLFIDASHIASRSVEIALALGLGFSLRSLHERIERIIDRIFFRHRQRALATLKSFASDVYFITDPDVALERTVDVVNRCADAGNVALYLIADGVFGCAAAIDPANLPSEISENDPLFVRMRASRQAEMPREVASSLYAEVAFPMFVRATLVGALVLAAKRTGEAYDPEETALLADLAGRVGLALDALQTAAIRRELESLLRATGGAATAL